MINSAFDFAGSWPPFFAVVGRLLALKFVEESKLSAGDMLRLFAKAADTVELADCGDEGILVLRHGFS